MLRAQERKSHAQPLLRDCVYLRTIGIFTRVSLTLFLSSPRRVGYLHTCNPLASGAHFIYETIASERVPAKRLRRDGKRNSLAIKFIPRSWLSPYLDLDSRNILTLVVLVVTNSRSPMKEREREGGGGEKREKDTRQRYVRVRGRCACTSLSNGWQRRVLSRREDNAHSCTQVPRGGHADAASRNHKSRTCIAARSARYRARLTELTWLANEKLEEN